MTWTKRQLIEQAYEEIGLANYVYDLTDERLQSAMYKLDSMMAVWHHKNLFLSYPISRSPQNADLDEDTTIPDYAAEAVYSNLALRLASAIGRTVSQELKQTAWYSYQGLLAQSTRPREIQWPDTLPRGAGNKPVRWDERFFNKPYGPHQPWDK